MHLPNDKIDITWGQLEEALRGEDWDYNVLSKIEHIDLINSCYPKPLKEI